MARKPLDSTPDYTIYRNDSTGTAYWQIAVTKDGVKAKSFVQRNFDSADAALEWLRGAQFSRPDEVVEFGRGAMDRPNTRVGAPDISRSDDYGEFGRL